MGLEKAEINNIFAAVTQTG